MVKTTTYCDCCKKEIAVKDTLKKMSFPVAVCNLQWIDQGSIQFPTSYREHDVCNPCYNLILISAWNEFQRISEETNAS